MTPLRVLAALLASIAIRQGIANAQTSAPTTSPVSVIEQSATPTVGTEGRVDVILPFDDLTPAPAGTRSDVVLRIVDKRPWGTGWRYDLRYVAAVPGEFDLTKSLRRDGADAPPTLPTVNVGAIGVLPEQYDGALVGVGGQRPRAWRWYWPVATTIVVAWVLLLVPLILRRRKRRSPVAPPVDDRPLTVAERLRPLVASAAKGTLDAAGQGELERLILHVWRRRLALGGLSSAAALLEIKRHADAGPLLVAIEDWLHRPPGTRTVSESQIRTLLAPYATLDDDAQIAGPAR